MSGNTKRGALLSGVPHHLIAVPCRTPSPAATATKVPRRAKAAIAAAPTAIAPLAGENRASV